MFAIRRKDGRGFCVHSGPRHNFVPALFRQHSHATNFLRVKGLNPDAYDIIRAQVFEIDENDRPIGLLAHPGKLSLTTLP